MAASRAVVCLFVVFVVVGWPAVTRGQTALSGDAIRITRARGPITVDGSLSDEAWLEATRIDKWYETNPGDNVEPKVKNLGYLIYDEKFFYAGFEFEDPNPGQMRAPYADRDNIGNGFNDYGGIIVDAGNTGRTATFFVVTPHNIQYDAITDDSSGEDSSPDFFWESAAVHGARLAREGYVHVHVADVRARRLLDTRLHTVYKIASCPKTTARP